MQNKRKATKDQELASGPSQTSKKTKLAQRDAGSSSESEGEEAEHRIADELEFIEEDRVLPIPLDEQAEAKKLADAKMRMEMQDPEIVKSWRRPEPLLEGNGQDLVFQQMDVNYTITFGVPRGFDRIHQTCPVPVVRFIGVTGEGNTIMCNVHGVVPYFYVALPGDMANIDQSSLLGLERDLKQHVLQKCWSKAVKNVILLGIELVERTPLMGYQGGKTSRYLRVNVLHPSQVPSVRAAFEGGIYLDSWGWFPRQTYESGVEFVLRCMIDLGIQGASWLTAPAKMYSLRRSEDHTSTCQLEVDVNARDLIAHQPDGEWSAVAPLRILSFDIECAGRRGHFPEAEQDPVIQIANVVNVVGRAGERAVIRNVFALGTCSPIKDAKVYSFATEGEMLEAWANFVRISDADILTGYNITNFDLPYLLNRSGVLRVPNFGYLGRIIGEVSVIKETTFESKAFGKRDYKSMNISGRIQYDVLELLRRNYKLRSYTLNSVSAHFLADQKDDVHHSQITVLQNGTADDRRRLAEYCIKDAELPQRLIDKLMLFINDVEMSRVTGVPFNYLLTRGQQIKVISQLYRKAGKRGMIVSTRVRKDAPGSGGGGVAYEGATVLDPERGYYNTPVATLDFASLYPSIMMAHNLCYSSLLEEADVERFGLSESDYTRTPIGKLFVKQEKHHGVLPEILTDLLGSRRRARDMLKVEKDPFKKQVLDGRQLALKISANSVYGFTGATVGQCPCMAISASVTAFGRDMIMLTKKLVEETYSMARGHHCDTRVIYGDTDSVMVIFGYDDADDVERLRKTMELAKEAAAFISRHFAAPIKLEFEKVYFPYLLINKKRYAGLYFTRPEKYDKIDSKGLELVRRDNCLLVPEMMKTVTRLIFVERNVEGAIAYVKGIVSALKMNKIDISMLVISKTRTKDEYKSKQPHMGVIEKIAKRNPANTPVIGDRVPYVVTQGPKNTPIYLLTEDPIFALENQIPLNTGYYIEKQMMKPLTRLFEHIIHERTKTLFAGDHTLSVSFQKGGTGGILQFMKPRPPCLSCNAPMELPKDGSPPPAVCAQCTSLETQVYIHTMNLHRKAETDYQRLWSQCQRCQNSAHKEVLCSANECEIFYMRARAKTDLQRSEDTVKRFAPRGDLSW